jgi:hypothetical protein
MYRFPQAVSSGDCRPNVSVLLCRLKRSCRLRRDVNINPLYSIDSRIAASNPPLFIFNPLYCTACEYGPIGFGALSVNNFFFIFYSVFLIWFLLFV